MPGINSPYRGREIAALLTTTMAKIRIRRQPPGVGLRDAQSRPHIRAMHLGLSDEETAALTQELHDIVEHDRYPFCHASARCRAYSPS